MTAVGDRTAARVGFQYVVLRCVPRVDREEFVNVGVVLYCQALDYLECAADVRPERLELLASELDLGGVRSSLAAIGAICSGDPAAGAAGTDSLGQRFGRLAAPKSTVIQPGPVHGGLTDDPARELERLMDTLIR